MSNVRSRMSTCAAPAHAGSLRADRNRGDTQFRNARVTLWPWFRGTGRAGLRARRVGSPQPGIRTPGARPRGSRATSRAWRSPSQPSTCAGDRRDPRRDGRRRGRGSAGARRIRRASRSSSERASSRSTAQAISASRNGWPSTSGRTRSCSRAAARGPPAPPSRGGPRGSRATSAPSPCSPVASRRGHGVQLLPAGRAVDRELGASGSGAARRRAQHGVDRVAGHHPVGRVLAAADADEARAPRRRPGARARPSRSTSRPTARRAAAAPRTCR